MKCREAHKLVIRAQDEKLSLVNRIGLRFHLFICGACTNFQRQMDLIRQALRQFPGDDGR